MTLLGETFPPPSEWRAEGDRVYVVIPGGPDVLLGHMLDESVARQIVYEHNAARSCYSPKPAGQQ